MDKGGTAIYGSSIGGNKVSNGCLYLSTYDTLPRKVRRLSLVNRSGIFSRVGIFGLLICVEVDLIEENKYYTKR